MSLFLTRSVSRFVPLLHYGEAVFNNNESRRFVRRLATVLRPGQTVLLREKLYTILKATHRKGTARQIGHVQLELRELRTQLKSTERLRSSEEIEVAFLKSENWEVLYLDTNEVVCIHPETYDQIKIPVFIFAEQKAYLCNGLTVSIESYEDQPVAGTLPVIIELKTRSVSAEIYDGMRLAEFENGLKMKVPSFVQSSDVVAINTQDHQFVKRMITKPV